jgi:hypothetical protein
MLPSFTNAAAAILHAYKECFGQYVGIKMKIDFRKPNNDPGDGNLL